MGELACGSRTRRLKGQKIIMVGGGKCMCGRFISKEVLYTLVFSIEVLFLCCGWHGYSEAEISYVFMYSLSLYG